MALSLVFKALIGLAGIGAGAAGLWAAHLWLRASKITIPEMESPQASVEDGPALYAYTVMVGVFETQSAFAQSSALNARAARWTALASALAATAAVLGVL